MKTLYPPFFVILMALIISPLYTFGQIECEFVPPNDCSDPLNCLFDGFPNIAIGEATLSLVTIGNTEVLRVDNIGENLTDGVRQIVPETQDMKTWIQTPNFTVTPKGATLVTNQIGVVDGVPDQFFSRMTIRDEGDVIHVNGDWSGIGATSYEIQVFSGSQLVTSQSGLQSGEFFLPKVNFEALDCEIAPPHKLTGDVDVVTIFSIPGVGDFEGDNFAIVAEEFSLNPTAQTEIEMFANFSPILITKERTVPAPGAYAAPKNNCADEVNCLFDGFPNIAIGEARLSIETINDLEVLRVDNIGSTLTDGVKQIVPGTQDMKTWLYQPNFSLSEEGSTLLVTQRGVVDGIADQLFSSMTIVNEGDQLHMIGDWSFTGTTSYEIQIFMGNELVTSQSGLSSGEMYLPVSDIQAADCTAPDELTGCVPVAIAWTIPEVGDFFGDNFVIRAEDFKQTPTEQIEIEMLAANLSPLLILRERTIPSPYSYDCNGNGIPDECDIAEGTLTDANNDNFPDECEQELPSGTSVKETFVSNKVILKQNYPNPFNEETVINFEVVETNNIEIAIYNVVGQKIRTLEKRKFISGAYQIVWNGKNDLNAKVPTGLYVYKFQADNQTVGKSMILIR